MKKIKKGILARIKTSKFEGNNHVGNMCHIHKSEIGKMSYFNSNCVILHSKVGRYCSFAGNVKTIIGSHPLSKWVSTHPAFYSPYNRCQKSYTDKRLYEEYKYIDEEKRFMIVIGNDVWIGTGAMVSSGVVIGDGAVVLAGAVVTKDVEPYSIVGGVPAKMVGKRFSDDEIEFLLKLKWWDKDEEWICQYAPLFNDISSLKKELEKENI